MTKGIICRVFSRPEYSIECLGPPVCVTDRTNPTGRYSGCTPVTTRVAPWCLHTSVQAPKTLSARRIHIRLLTGNKPDREPGDLFRTFY